MGYYTTYQLTVTPLDVDPTDLNTPQSIIDWVRDQSMAAFWAVGPEGTSGTPGSWPKHDDEMRALSARVPGWLFTLDGEGGESGDLWRKFYYGGKASEFRQPRWAPPAFDPAALR